MSRRRQLTLQTALPRLVLVSLSAGAVVVTSLGGLAGCDTDQDGAGGPVGNHTHEAVSKPDLGADAGPALTPARTPTLTPIAPSAPIAAETMAPPVPTALERFAMHIDDDDGTSLGLDHLARGRALLHKGEAMNAIGELRLGLSIDQGADVWTDLGDAYLRVGDVEKGVACLEEALVGDVDFEPARRLLARQALSDRDGVSARRHAEEWVRIAPTSTAARQSLGRAYSQLGMWKEAIDAFDEVLAVQPDNIYARNNIGFAALQLGENELALEHLEQVRRLEPQQGYMLNNLGVAYERLARPAEAHAAFARAAELSPRYLQAALNRDRVQTDLDPAQQLASADTLRKLRVGDVSDLPAPDRAVSPIALPAVPLTRSVLDDDAGAATGDAPVDAG